MASIVNKNENNNLPLSIMKTMKRRRPSSPGKANSNLTTKTKQRKKSKTQHNRKAQTSLSSLSFSSSSKSSIIEYPLPYPTSSELKYPKNTFLRYQDPYKNSFQKALDTSYLGFEIDLSVTHDDLKKKNSTARSTGKNNTYFDHDGIQEALLTMDKHGLFRTDVTQPFGLGTKCAKTYVTRCLLGEEGTTYKYLGLRMFAHPWKAKYSSSSGNSLSQQKDTSSSSMSLEDALNQISNLNNSLTTRTAYHLNQLDGKRKLIKKSTKSTTKGRAKFDVALINRMVDTKELKREPTMGDGRCSVSWHADSSLEHYSSIAVYHTIMDENFVNERILKDGQGRDKVDKEMKKTKKTNESNSDRWSIALRVAHDSEGPGSSNRGTDIESSVISNTPPIAISLPSRSAYYLLDDFNHHHQHAVLVNDHNADGNFAAGVRYASTHRLLREGHNVYFVLNRCRSICSQFHKKGPKIWRSEQLLLTEIESEWLRQFFIQGEGHKSNLWKYWREPICELLQYWSRLEQRTKQIFDLLKYAAHERCRSKIDEGAKGTTYSRKERDKMKKSLLAVDEILSRGKTNELKPGDVVSCIYEPFSKLIDDRAKMRELWNQRQKDGLFKSMNFEYRPIDVPFVFNIHPSSNQVIDKNKLKDFGESPLGGSDDDLKKMSVHIMQFGSAFKYQNPSYLPAIDTKHDCVKITANQQKKCDQNQHHEESSSSINMVNDPTEHQKDSGWVGWGKHIFGLEMQSPWAGLLLNGNKTIETRSYNLPKALIGKRILILESKSREARVSSLPNRIAHQEISDYVKVVGWVVFKKVIIYRYRSKFEADEKRHLVKKNSGYAWKEDTKVVYGWAVGAKGSFCSTTGHQMSPSLQSLTRRMRSLFEYS